MPHMYILQCSDGSYYCGCTTDVERRLKQHNSGKGSKCVRSRLPAKVICTSSGTMTRSEACKLEYAIKQLPRNKKVEALIRHICKESIHI